MEEYLFGNLDQHDLVVNGVHPETPFYESFLNLSKEIWLVHRLEFSFDPIVSIFHLRRRTNFSVVYMETVGHDVLSSDCKSIVTLEDILDVLIVFFHKKMILVM